MIERKHTHGHTLEQVHVKGVYQVHPAFSLGSGAHHH